jgi:uncharacterized membrane protein YbhN (UPF0104 family)
VALGPFIGYSFSHNLGFAAVTGSAVRYRLYSSWGYTGVEVAKIAAICASAYFLGFFTLCGVVFLVATPPLPGALEVGNTVRVTFAMSCLAVVIVYLAWVARGGPMVRLRALELPPPSLKLGLLCIVLSVADWMVATGVLYMLLPGSAGVSYVQLLGVFLLAAIIGGISHVPGGLGVFETVVLVCLQAHLLPSQVLGCLLVYRAIYFILPFVVATVLLGVYEFSRRRRLLQASSRQSA